MRNNFASLASPKLLCPKGAKCSAPWRSSNQFRLWSSQAPPRFNARVTHQQMTLGAHGDIMEWHSFCKIIWKLDWEKCSRAVTFLLHRWWRHLTKCPSLHFPILGTDSHVKHLQKEENLEETTPMSKTPVNCSKFWAPEATVCMGLALLAIRTACVQKICSCAQKNWDRNVHRKMCTLQGSCLCLF